MDFLLTAEQQEIVSSVGALLAAECPISRIRDGFAERSSVDRSLWATCAALGWFGLGLDEAAGGVGYGLTEEALLFREIGRHLAPGPLLPTVIGARAAAGTGSADLTRAILDGTLAVGLAHPLGDAEVGPRVTAELALFDAAGTDLVLIAGPAGAALVDAAVLVDVTDLGCLDPASRFARARVDDVPAAAFVDRGADPLFLRGAVLAAAMASGVAEAARDMAAEHARSRVQFGRPIGVNQAVKHACADMAVRAEAATSQSFLAAMTLDRSQADAAFQVASAKVVATDAALRNTRANIQVHGGMGFTWEHDAHLLLKRTHVLGLVFGDRRHHLSELISLPAPRY
jgi:alkylation response protein AidB-like acyl-CoA dehydrogenase